MNNKQPLLIALLLSMIVLSGLSSVVEAGDTITGQQLLSRIEQHSAPLILDVRSPREYAEGHVPGAINIPHKRLQQRIDEIMPHKQREITVYCEAGVRAAYTEDILVQAGFKKILHLEGDMRGWRAAKLPQEH